MNDSTKERVLFTTAIVLALLAETIVEATVSFLQMVF